MPEKKITILSTRPLEQSLLAQASVNKIEIDCIPFIKTAPVRNTCLEKRITETFSESLPVIFTSMNAAEAVAAYLTGTQPQWNVYSLGTATKNIIRLRFPRSNIIGEAENASSLADKIIMNEEKALIFFCGDLRRDELPDKLAGHNIELEEIVVYNTLLVSKKLEKAYDGILFFSPSAVESFFSLNTVPDNTILFAIGTTTSACLRQHSSNKIIESDYPGKKSLLEKSVDYFAQSNQPNEHIKK